MRLKDILLVSSTFVYGSLAIHAPSDEDDSLAGDNNLDLADTATSDAAGILENTSAESLAQRLKELREREDAVSKSEALLAARETAPSEQQHATVEQAIAAAGQTQAKIAAIAASAQAEADLVTGIAKGMQKLPVQQQPNDNNPAGAISHSILDSIIPAVNLKPLPVDVAAWANQQEQLDKTSPQIGTSDNAPFPPQAATSISESNAVDKRKVHSNSPEMSAKVAAKAAHALGGSKNDVAKAAGKAAGSAASSTGKSPAEAAKMAAKAVKAAGGSAGTASKMAADAARHAAMKAGMSPAAVGKEVTNAMQQSGASSGESTRAGVNAAVKAAAFEKPRTTENSASVAAVNLFGVI